MSQVLSKYYPIWETNYLNSMTWIELESDTFNKSRGLPIWSREEKDMMIKECKDRAEYYKEMKAKFPIITGNA